jgi:DNA (cytosine-5)-methyltransferase 1
MTKSTIFSFFAGAGFLDLGFENTGYEVGFVNEFHVPFLDAYKHSRKVMKIAEPKFGYDSASISTLDASIISQNMKTERTLGQIVGFIGGPPCPDFSVGGKNRGETGENGRLSQVYIDLICETLPDYFLFENVKGLYRTKKHRTFFEELKDKLRQAGYRLHERLINAIEYGAPQDRDRIILLGFRETDLAKTFEWQHRAFPDRSAFAYDWPDTQPFVEGSERPSPNNVPVELTVEHWFRQNAVTMHPNSEHAFTPRAGLKRFLSVDEGDDNKKSYKRLHRWRYSPTAAYGNNEVHVHPYKARRISVAEALAIQSLPADFELPASMTLSNMFKTVGNGVPYMAALGLAKAVMHHLGGQDEANSTKFGIGHSRTAA